MGKKCSWLDLNSAPLGCEDSYSEASQVVLSGVLLRFYEILQKNSTSILAHA